MKVLLVEDDKKISDFVTEGLTQAGFQVEVAADGQAGLALAEHGGFDLLVADVMLPKKDGLQLVTELRSGGQQMPVLFLSAKRSVDERLQGFQSGGDDYLTKPFAFSELLARCQALLRRTGRTQHESSHLRAADLELDLLTREVKRGAERIELQNKEFTLLEYFLRNPGRALSKAQILEKVWQYDFDPQTNVVDVLVCRLRNKIERGSQKYIKTIRGVGYVFRQD